MLESLQHRQGHGHDQQHIQRSGDQEIEGQRRYRSHAILNERRLRGGELPAVRGAHGARGHCGGPQRRTGQLRQFAKDGVGPRRRSIHALRQRANYTGAVPESARGRTERAGLAGAHQTSDATRAAQLLAGDYVEE